MSLVKYWAADGDLLCEETEDCNIPVVKAAEVEALVTDVVTQLATLTTALREREDRYVEAVRERNDLRELRRDLQQQLAQAERASQLVHYIVEHPDGDFDKPTVIQAEAEQFCIENVLAMKQQLAAMTAERAEFAGRICEQQAELSCADDMLAERDESCTELRNDNNTLMHQLGERDATIKRLEAALKAEER